MLLSLQAVYGWVDRVIVLYYFINTMMLQLDRGYFSLSVYPV